MTLTHWKKLENPDYIGSYAFQPGETKTVTIAKVTREIVTGPDGKKEECTIVHFVENEKPLILNATNGKMISKLTDTPYIEQWAGHRIMLGVEKVKAFGDVVEAVRVKKTKLSQNAPQASEIPFCADCGGTIEAVDGVTVERIVSAGMKRYGAPLCMSCAKKRTEANKQTQETKEDLIHENDQNQDQ